MDHSHAMIPQADPGAGYRAQKDEIDAAVARALAAAGTSSAGKAKPSSGNSPLGSAPPARWAAPTARTRWR
jgi:hypothetical protein